MIFNKTMRLSGSSCTADTNPASRSGRPMAHKTETGLGSGRSVSDDFIAVVDGYWFRDGISDWKDYGPECSKVASGEQDCPASRKD